MFTIPFVVFLGLGAVHRVELSVFVTVSILFRSGVITLESAPEFSELPA